VSDVFALDTNALLYYATDQFNRLGRQAKEVISRFEGGSASLVVPSPVLVEIWFLLKAGRFVAEPTLGKWWNRLTRSGLLSVDLTAEDVVTATSLHWDHRDSYDRLIVAIALRVGCPLVTADAAISEWGGIDVVW